MPPYQLLLGQGHEEWSMSRCQCARICQQCHEHYTRSSDQLEFAVAMIASCLPALRNLFKRLQSKLTSAFLFEKFNRSGSSKSKDTNGFSQIGDKKPWVRFKDLDMTTVTINREEIQYPKKAPPIPKKTWRNDEGVFKI
jgi:hypothetical protein